MGVFQRKVSESPRKVQNVRLLTTKIRQEVFQKECFLLDLFTYVITSFDSLERMVTIMKRFYTAESVTEGHPDKLCDLIADSILDACLKEDENSRVACEVLATKGNIIVAGEITSRFEPQVFEIIKKVLESAGYEAEEIHMDALIHKQSPDIAGAVERSRERRAGTVSVQSGLASGAGDQGIMIGYACDETPQLMPMPVVLANRIVRELSASRRSGYITGILPDGKAQVTVEYEDDRPVRLETVVLLSHKKPDSVINVKVEFGEGEGKIPLDNIEKRAESYKPKERATYKMIKEYIEAKHGFKVHTAYIAEVKRDLGLPMYDAPNAVEELKQPRKHPTPEKVEAIKDALKHFEVI